MGLVKPIVKTAVRGQLNVKNLMEMMKKHKNAYVTVGVHQDAGRYTEGSNPPEVAQVALWNEFGTENMPERSFFRSALSESESKINSWREEMIVQILEGKMDIKKALESIGFRVQVLIQNKIKSNVPPKLASSTARGKTRDGVAPVTLIDTGLMLRSVTYRVVLG